MATMLVCGYTKVMEMSLEIILGVFFFIFGTLIGSFLNVVIFRHNTGKGLSGRSKCQSCGRVLNPAELIPILSFLIQGGVCRACKSKVSPQYPLVELLTGALFLLVYFTYTSITEIILGLIVVSLLIIIMVYDYKHGIIPNTFVYGFIALSLFVLFFNVHTLSFVQPSKWALLAGPILAIPIWLLWQISKGKWIGLGDAKLFLGIGWFLGVSEGITAFALSFWIGAVVGLLLISIQRLMRIKVLRPKGRSIEPVLTPRFGNVKASLFRFSRSTSLIRKLNLGFKDLTIKTEIPFAPFIILGFLIVYFSGFNLVAFITP